MADALCGPSNALQSFQKHSQADRSLQQDRLIGSSQPPAQGFRTFDPRVGSLDAEFHAFENAPTNPFQLEQPAWRHGAPPRQMAPSALSWASDFQNLRVSESPAPVSQFRTEAPLVRNAPGGWQQEFMRQRESPTALGKQKQPEISSFAMSQQSFLPFTASASLVPQQNGIYQQDTMSQQLNATKPQLHEADFERAFQDAFDQMDSMDAQLKAADEMTEEGHDPLMEESLIQEPSQMKIGSDAIEYTEVQDRTIDQDARDANALARVAGELVQNVDHETNEKFKNSQFLDLMRRIRDREVEVRNNDLENTHLQTDATEKQLEHSDLRPHDPNTFQFPDMNNVYRPDETIDTAADDSFVYQPAEPRTQISDLHPGGPLYPEQSPPQPRHAQMSGAVNTSVSADDTSTRYATA